MADGMMGWDGGIESSCLFFLLRGDPKKSNLEVMLFFGKEKGMMNHLPYPKRIDM